jgi:hypothetical protein
MAKTSLEIKTQKFKKKFCHICCQKPWFFRDLSTLDGSDMYSIEILRHNITLY